MKIRLIWDECNPTIDRRPTTSEDIENDIHLQEFDNEEELLNKLAEMVGYSEEDLEDCGDDNREKIDCLLSTMSDPGDGTPNILFLSIDDDIIQDWLEQIDGLVCSEQDVKDEMMQYAEDEPWDYDEEFDESEEIEDEPKLTTDELNGGQWYEGLENKDNKESLNEEKIEESYKSTWDNLLKKLDELDIDWNYKDSRWNPEIEELIEIDGEDAFALCEDGICYGEELMYWDGRFNAMKALKTLYQEAPERYPSLKKLVELKDSLEEEKLDEMAKLPYGVLAWKLGEIMMSMNNEEAYYGGWLYIWPDGETREQCMEDFGTKEDYEELRQSFERYYKAYHDDGLYTTNQNIIDYAHKIDQKLGLEPIENYGKIDNKDMGDDPFDESLTESKLDEGEYIDSLAIEGKWSCVYTDGNNREIPFEEDDYLVKTFDTKEEAEEFAHKTIKETADVYGHNFVSVFNPDQEEILTLNSEEEKFLTEASSAEKKAFKNGGKDLNDLIQGRSIGRIKDPDAQAAAVAAVKAGREDVVKQFTGERKENQALTNYEDKANKMAKAGVLDEGKKLTWDNIEQALWSKEYNGPVHSEINYGCLRGFESRSDASQAADFIEKKFKVDCDVERDPFEHDGWVIKVHGNVLNEDLEDLPTEIEIEADQLDGPSVQYLGLEETIEDYIQEHYGHRPVDWHFYWQDEDIIIIHDINWDGHEDNTDSFIDMLNDEELDEDINISVNNEEIKINDGEDDVAVIPTPDAEEIEIIDDEEEPVEESLEYKDLSDEDKVRRWAEADFGSGESFDIDNYNEFAELCKKEGIEPSEKLFNHYIDVLDGCKQSCEEKLECENLKEDLTDKLLDDLIHMDEEDLNECGNQIPEWEERKNKVLEYYNQVKEWATDPKAKTSCMCNVGIDTLNEWLGENKND